MTTRYIIGDVFEQLALLEPDSVDLIVSSPPFLALRSYLPTNHPNKHQEIGSENTPGAYIDVLIDVVEACARVLAPHGSLVFELGDTYAGGGGWPIDDPRTPHRDGSELLLRGKHPAGNGWPLDKSKTLIPQLFAITLAYGTNPLTGRQTDPWRIRNTVAWCRPNPPVGRDGDKYRPATSFLTVACKARDRYWDGDAVRTALTPRAERELAEGRVTSGSTAKHDDAMVLSSGQGNGTQNPAGAPLLDHWTIPTHPYKGTHYATWPPDLVIPLVKSMCPQRVCRECGEPSRRIVQNERDGYGGTYMRKGNPDRNDNGASHFPTADYTTLGWSDCGHDSWRPGMVLDQFAGSGTTLAVASGHGLDSIGVDLDARNAELARDRVGGLLLEIVT